MQGWYWDYPKPDCNGYTEPSIANEMAGRAAAQSDAGFTMMWMPPMSQASFGDCSNGYDPQDLYDYGQISGKTGLGTGAEVENWISALTSNTMIPVADVVYNHRDGGEWEDNPVVENYILNYPISACSEGATPYPVNGKVRYVLPLGGESGNEAGDYYFKFSSASGNTDFNGREYKLFFRTSDTVFEDNPLAETEPNGGGDCGEDSDEIFLGRDITAIQEVGGSCNTDEFKLILTTDDFNSSGDQLEIYIEQINGGGTGIDQRIYGLYSDDRDTDIAGELTIQTRTDFTNLPSDSVSGLPASKGQMTFRHFKPNGVNPTCMTGDEEFPFFFFDVEQAYDGSQGGESTRTVYNEWNQWLWEEVDIRGFRMDAVKHFPAWFVGQLLNDLHNAGKNPPMVVGEHFTTDAGVLKGWIDAVYQEMTPSAASNINVRAFDFELRAALKQAADNGLYDVRNIFNSGLVDGEGMSGVNAVTFVNNHDYRTVGEHILNRQMLAYAYILTNNKIGLPSVFYPDYYGVDIYGPTNPLEQQQEKIDELMKVHKDFIFGATFVDYLNRFDTPYTSAYLQSGASDHLLYQLQGGNEDRDVIVVINFENQALRVNHQINTANTPLGTQYRLVAGDANYKTLVVENSSNGISNSLYFDIPAYSYAVFVEASEFSENITTGPGWRLLSSPVQGASYNDLLSGMWTQGVPGAADGNWDGSEPNVLTWSNDQDGFDSQNWLTPASLNDEIPTGKGFMAYIFDLDDLNDPNSGGFNKLMSISGVPNQPDISPELNSSNNHADGWSLLGNPFEESISFVNIDKSNLTDVAYIYDPNMNETTNGNNGGWKTTDGVVGEIFDGEIAPFQGFFVQNDATANPAQITFTESSKITNTAEFFGKNLEVYRIRMEIVGNELSNSMWLRFSEKGSFEKVAGDAIELYPFEENYLVLASEKEGKRFDIAQLPLNIEDNEVPIAIETNQSGSYTLKITDVYLPAGLSLELLDRKTGEKYRVEQDTQFIFEWDKITKENPLKEVAGNLNEPKNIIKFGPMASIAGEESRFIMRKMQNDNSQNTLPSDFTLHQNYPNPFNPTTVISYDLPENSQVNLAVYDMMGRRVATLVNENVAAGTHQVQFDAGSLSSGTYMYRLQAGGNIQTKKLTLIK